MNPSRRMKASHGVRDLETVSVASVARVGSCSLRSRRDSKKKCEKLTSPGVNRPAEQVRECLCLRLLYPYVRVVSEPELNDC